MVFILSRGMVLHTVYGKKSQKVKLLFPVHKYVADAPVSEGIFIYLCDRFAQNHL